MTAPKPPKVDAPIDEHRRFALEVDAYEPYGEVPPGGVELDPIPEGEGPDHEEE